MGQKLASRYDIAARKFYRGNHHDRRDALEAGGRWNIQEELLLNFRLTILELFDWNRTRAAEFMQVSLRSFRKQLAMYRRKGYEIPPSAGAFRNPSAAEMELIRQWVEKITYQHLRPLHAAKAPENIWQRLQIELSPERSRKCSSF